MGKTFLIFISALFLFTSCSFVKRVYRSGYYCNRNESIKPGVYLSSKNRLPKNYSKRPQTAFTNNTNLANQVSVFRDNEPEIKILSQTGKIKSGLNSFPLEKSGALILGEKNSPLFNSPQPGITKKQCPIYWDLDKNCWRDILLVLLISILAIFILCLAVWIALMGSSWILTGILVAFLSDGLIMFNIDNVGSELVEAEGEPLSLKYFVMWISIFLSVLVIVLLFPISLFLFEIIYWMKNFFQQRHLAGY